MAEAVGVLGCVGVALTRLFSKNAAISLVPYRKLFVVSGKVLVQPKSVRMVYEEDQLDYLTLAGIYSLCSNTLVD